MARYLHPNPLDALFLAIDRAWQRCGLWGADIHFYIELRGEVVLERLCRAMAGLYRLYPATGGRLVRRWWWRQPAWRLDCPPADAQQAVQLVELSGPEQTDLLATLDTLVNQRIDLATGPPMRAWVLRGMPAGDVVVLRWPHALADARGGEHLVRELVRLGRSGVDPQSLASVGDEDYPGFGTLDDRIGYWRCVRLLRQSPEAWPAASGDAVRLGSAERRRGDERLRVFVRRFEPEQWSAIKAAATGVCGFARVADFVRACAIKALDTLADELGLEGQSYSTFHLVENRKRRDHRPVCHNVFTTVPVRIARELAADRRRVADELQAATARLLEPGAMQRRLAGLKLLSLMGTERLAREIQRGLERGRARLPIGLVRSPSMPLGFMNLLPRGLGDFCGAEFVNLYGLRAAGPLSGLGITMCTVGQRMNICGLHVEPHVPRSVMERLLDLFVDNMFDARA